MTCRGPALNSSIQHEIKLSTVLVTSLRHSNISWETVAISQSSIATSCRCHVVRKSLQSLYISRVTFLPTEMLFLSCNFINGEEDKSPVTLNVEPSRSNWGLSASLPYRVPSNSASLPDRLCHMEHCLFSVYLALMRLQSLDFISLATTQH